MKMQLEKKVYDWKKERTPYFQSIYGKLVCDMKEFTPTIAVLANDCDVLVVGGGDPDLYNYIFSLLVVIAHQTTVGL